MRVVYTALLYLATPLVFLRLLWKSRQLPEYRGRIGERFGFVPPRAEGVAVWVHAVSVGEALAALPLIEALLKRHGDGQVWVTTTTPTGSARISAALGERVRHSYAPYDLPDVISRFLQRVRPRQVIVMETELWPNQFHCLAQHGVPLTIANARLSPGSFRGYMRVPGFARSTLADCSAIAAQSEEDAQRFLALGAPPERVSVMGNLKFDLELPEVQLAAGRSLREAFGTQRPVWIAASTHEGEEEAALDAHQALLDVFPDAVLILVPRHPQRFDNIWRLITDKGFVAERRTRSAALAKAGRAQSLTQTQVFLGDSMGEMFVYLAAADIAFIGGSLVDVGGHNVLEPAALGVPVLFGPYMYNFALARASLLACGAALEVADAPALTSELAVLLGEPGRRAQMGRAGLATVAGSRGALRRLLALLDAQRAAL
ncbi:MAG: 3-deoxy-D-manno-octulosonic acid transferase [Nevskia sp.]|nr:3-deoxy-D-manno-octulosonic acid transferase [Nevskia sp.]